MNILRMLGSLGALVSTTADFPRERRLPLGSVSFDFEFNREPVVDLVSNPCLAPPNPSFIRKYYFSNVRRPPSSGRSVFLLPLLVSLLFCSTQG